VYEIGDGFSRHIDAAGSGRHGPAPVLPEAPMTGPARREPRITTRLTLVACCSIALAAPALSQPTEEQRSAVRNACQSEFIANCAGVQPGGANALACLLRNSAKLSPQCRSAVDALNLPPESGQQAAPAGAVPPSQPAAASAPPPASIPAPPPGAAAPAQITAPAAPPSAPTATAARRPTPQQQAAIRSACRSDFIANCSGVQPGGADALACLQGNAARLSPACQNALAALRAPGSPSAARAPAAAAPPVGAAAPMPPLPPIALLMIRRRCRADIATVCPLPPGGGRIVQCLAANAPSLSPVCQGALAEARAMAR
jgi:hypothetical protein